MSDAVKILNEDHYGLEKIKERITEYLAVEPTYVFLCPRISASSFTPPRLILTNFLPRLLAIDDAIEVLPTI